MGLILGGIPLILKIAASGEKLKKVRLSPFLLGFALIAALFVVEKSGAFETGAVQTADFAFTLRIAFYAFTAAIAMVMPGISGAFVLVAFGVYEMFMNGLKALDFTIIAPAAAGILFGIVVGAKMILFLLKKFKSVVYGAITGMVAGSALPLFPEGAGLNAATLAGIPCFAAGMAAGLFLGKKNGGEHNLQK
jgi:putative membrane protein